MKFDYRAYLSDGREEIGTVDANAGPEAIRQLSVRGRSVFELRQAKTAIRGNTLRASRARAHIFRSRKVDLDRLFADLAVLTDSGMTVTQALRAMQAGGDFTARGNAVEKVLRDLSSGKSAREAFLSVPGIGMDAIALIASGEGTGQLPSVFKALAHDYGERKRRRAQLLDSLSYPLFLLVLAVAAVGVVTFVLVPAIEPVFDDASRKPPMIVVLLSLLRHLLSGPLIGFAVPLTLVLSVLLWPTLKRGQMRGAFSALWMRMPFFGTILREAGLARYLASLSMLLGNGALMTQALSLAADCISLPTLRQRLHKVRERVAAGERLPDALAQTGLFDTRIVSLIAVGDEASRLPTVISRAAVILDEEATRRLKRWTGMLTPALTILLGLLIGGLVVSVMTALLGINELAIQ